MPRTSMVIAMDIVPKIKAEKEIKHTYQSKQAQISSQAVY